MTERNQRLMDVEMLRAEVRDGHIDTVIVAFTDMQGRLQGKRLHAAYFLDVALAHGIEGCNYLLSVDVDMNTVDGYAISSWDQGYGDMRFVPDLGTIRRLAHLPGTVMIQCDLQWLDGSAVAQSARTILREQAAAAEAAGFDRSREPVEFILDTTYEDAWHRGYRSLPAANQYNVDYSILGTTRVEPLLREIRNTMYAG